MDRASSYDVAVIGGGAAGLATAAAAARRGARVALCEQSADFGMHSSGRSTASLDPIIGPEPVRALTEQSLRWMTTSSGLVEKRPLLVVSDDDIHRRVNEDPLLLVDAARTRFVGVRRVRQMCPVLRPRQAAGGGLLVEDAYDINAKAMLARFRSDATQAGAMLLRSAGVERITRVRGRWVLHGPFGRVQASIIVNAAGAWADQVALLAGVEPLGLAPLKRSLLVVEGPPGCAAWPLTNGVAPPFCLAPRRGDRLIVSAVEEIPDDADEARIQRSDLRRVVETFETATTLPMTHVRAAWAGHRTYAPDRVPVIGADPGCDTFVWCAALGGSGIQTAAASGAAAADAAGGQAPPQSLLAVSPARLRAGGGAP